ncbi:MAG: hypothetical protein H0T84_04125 [Tatlockia sp.]|nr:hypothetical protein [Tatlockia sp.]
MKAQVFYFYKNFGHIAVKITFSEANGFYKDSPIANFLKENNEIYFNYGGSRSFDEECEVFGEYVCIDLPETTKGTLNFFKELKKTDYLYCNLGEFGICSDESRNYDLLTNNCAHATLEILRIAGYIDIESKKILTFLPSTVAEQVVNFAQKGLSESRMQVIDSSKKSTEQDNRAYIQRLIQLSCERLKNELIFGYSIHRQSRLNDLSLLSTIGYDGSTESMSKLLFAFEEASWSTADELQQCINLLHPGRNLQLSIARLFSAASNIEARNPKFRDDAVCARELAMKLDLKRVSLEKNEINYKSFQNDCLALIKIDRATLEAHRGYKRIVGNIALAIIGLGVFYLVAASINYAVNDYFLFFKETKTSSIINDFESEIGNPNTTTLA